MSIFSIDWFKSEKKKELEKEKLESKIMKEKLWQVQLQKEMQVLTTVTSQTTIPPEVQIRACKSVKLVGDTLTVVLNDGAIISKLSATHDDFKHVRALTDEDDLLLFMTSQEGRTEAKKSFDSLTKAKLVRDNVERLALLKDFELKDSALYLTGTSRSIPEILVMEFVDVLDDYDFSINIDELEKNLVGNDKYQALKNFFLWCCLNPRAEVADQLYAFLKRNSFRITRQGFFVALRNVVRIRGNENSELVDFISNSYNKIKAVWKKKPSDFVVYEVDGDYKITKTEDFKNMEKLPAVINLGNLETLYLDLPNMSGNRFTDAHTGTFDIRVGQPVNMPPEKCSWSTRDCAEAGLHFTADEIHYVGCGDTSVLVLINPMKVVGIGSSKGRCYEYLPIMTVPRDEATTILHDLDFDTLELDEDYAVRELKGLAEKAKAGFAAETTKYQFNLPEISTMEITKIVSSLKDMEKILSKRVSIIK